jgi:hypothetical protein
VCGFGWLSWPWLAACFALGYGRGVLVMGDRTTDGDFTSSSDEHLAQTSRVAKLSAAMTVIPVGVFFTLGMLASHLSR